MEDGKSPSVSVPRNDNFSTAFIDLTIKKPAWKRTEVVEGTDETDTPTDELSASPAESGGRLRRTAGVAGPLAVGVVGLVTLRKLRNRRKNTESDEKAAE